MMTHLPLLTSPTSANQTALDNPQSYPSHFYPS
jgi:hypothetical protein